MCQLTGLQPRLKLPVCVAGGADTPRPSHAPVSRAPSAPAAAQSPSVGIRPPLETCAGWGVSGDTAFILAGHLLSLPSIAGTFHFYCLQLCGIFSEGLESQGDWSARPRRFLTVVLLGALQSKHPET